MINSDGKTIFFTKEKDCIPKKQELDAQYKAGYKFKLDGKAISKKKIEELLK